MSKRSVLFISPAFFGYEKCIKDAIAENGYDVDFFDERPSNSGLMKALVRTKKGVLDLIIKNHFNNIAKSIEGKKYDFFLLIKGEITPKKFIREFKENNPSAKLVYYTFDASNNNSKNGVEVQKLFDTCYSIDFRDVKQNSHLKLKHLFYSKDFVQLPADLYKKKDYEISFVGTLHSNRYMVMKNTFGQFKNSFLFFYSPARWWFLYNKSFNKDYREIKWSSISFKKLNLAEVASIFKASKSVLDIQRYGQAGLTMRTFEVLASGAVLITTNQFIREVDFFDENRIVCIGENGIPEEKVKEIKSKIDLNTFDSNKFEKYYVVNWVKEFFE